MLSLAEMRRATEALVESRVGARVERVVQPSADRVELLLSGGRDRPARDRCTLVLSCAPSQGRLGLRDKPGPAPPRPPAFAQYLRAHLEGAQLTDLGLDGADRQLRLRFAGPEEDRVLLFSLLGNRSNLYVLDEADRLVAALRPLEKTRRLLALGEPWRDPESPAPPVGEDRFPELAGEALLRAIESFYIAREEEGRADSERRRVAQALKKQRDAILRKQKAVLRDQEAAARAAEYERFGELLKGCLASVRAGADHVDATDYATGEKVRVPLDPKLSPAANLELLFKRHRKAVKQGLRAEQELGVVAQRLEENQALRESFEVLPEEDEEALRRFAEASEVRRLLERFFPAPKEPRERPKPHKIGKREIPARLMPKRYRTRDGLEIWVGRSDEGNDLLTTRLARGRDLFLHLEGSPGSHVILRMEAKGDPPQESLLEACELAVHHSKQKKASRASVHVAAIKDVSKPKGAKRGLVYVHRGRTVQLRRDPARLERVLAARIED